MSRIVFNLLLFLLPFLIYGGYIAALRRLNPGVARRWADAPFGWLLLSGMAIGVLALAFSVLWSEPPPGEAYAPKRLVDGQIVPGEAEASPDE